jgi:hypothetical protein
MEAPLDPPGSRYSRYTSVNTSRNWGFTRYITRYKPLRTRYVFNGENED